MPRVPAYFDACLEAIDQGAAIDHVHLGHWDQPDAVGPSRARAGFARAQARLSEHCVDRLELRTGDRVLDVGCGFGGTVRAIRQSHPGIAVIGLNIDVRQLAVAHRGDGMPDKAAWVAADACRLPFRDSVFEKLLCVEAAFHFASRQIFFEEAYRVLSPGGVLVMSDIVLAKPPLPVATIAAFADRLEADYGPWPAIWTSLDATRADAERAGFALEVTDATANTWPSYHTIAPDDRAGLTGGVVLRELHRLGCLRYLHLRLERR
ncbi:class I SAM-dependent methyltransferase [Methylobacterium haplocladii]|uniref:Methyltransferase type 11 n=1 Tax=Methylobacterium haplocladii TaxID=1176176 RepID=A0A512IMD1_9HYPH|nr:class I SAM-dependent methyltransferase [Methylobacterium haplocladii]GEO98831.1 methyltransferase type 11 [Methylobacterium haplocladii]GJD85152.1 27-O-demethylrifamycin SV methyltransferase [Methylobacterium haplocladii]GLS58791.1 methyltransferase type 11 [Methylobacterium haplocladii]